MSGPMCYAKVWSAGAIRSSSCRNAGKVERDGKHYCNRHDPVARAERDAQKAAERDAEMRSLMAHRRAVAATAAETKRRADCYAELMAELLLCKQFLEDMHTQNVDWTVIESQIRHKAVSDILAKHGESA